MKKLAKEILDIAKELTGDVRIEFERKDELEGSGYNSIHLEMQRYADKVRRNESLDIYLGRIDTSKTMSLVLGVSDHQEKEAIIREFRNLAGKVGKKCNVNVKVSHLY